MSHSHLTIAEREVISKMYFTGASLSKIGKTLGRHRGTISREIKRNSLAGLDYYAAYQADWMAEQRRSQSKQGFVNHTSAVWEYVKEQLQEGWSPEQIVGRMQRMFPDDPSMRISHETIYARVWAEKREGGLLWKNLRQSGRKRRKRYGSLSRRGAIRGRVGIAERPPVVAARSRLGDWESDTMEGKAKRGYLVTHVERKSRYVVVARLDNKRAETLNCGTRRAFEAIPRSLCRTLTVDNGKEFAKFKGLEELLSVDVYFADPYSPWQRGTNENTNGLLREYFPKKMNLYEVSDFEVAAAQRKLNNRPRKCLGYRTPHEVLFET